jgi:hypothetical protein
VPDHIPKDLVTHRTPMLPAIPPAYSPRHPGLKRPQLDESGRRGL